MSGNDPKTLFEHQASVKGMQGTAKPRPLEDMLEFARRKLRALGVIERSAVLAALADPGSAAYHAAWLQRHAIKAADILLRANAENRAGLREMWLHAFYAGAAHQTIKADHHYLHTVRGQLSRTKKLVEARQKSADKRRKFSDAKLAAMQAAGLSRKGQAKALGVTRQAINKRQRNKRQPG